MKKLSIAIAVFNEEKNLDRCLESIKNITDEIILVDGGSTDETIEIALNYKAHIIKTTNPLIFHLNKQKAVEACTGEWILQLDADEEVSKKLAAEIHNVISMSDKEREQYQIDEKKHRLFLRHQQLIENRDDISYSKDGPINAYYLPRRNYFLGKAMTYAGMYPDGVIRLFKNGKASFPSHSVHEQIQIEGKVGWLGQDLLHYSNPTLQKYLLGASKYTKLLSKEIAKDNHNEFSKFFIYFIQKPIFTFISLFIRHKGIFDGFHGFLFSLFSSCHFPVAYIKYVTKKN